MSTYRMRVDIPPLVQRAMQLAKLQEFERSCIPEVGRLLGVLASHVQHGVVGEIGTGTGVGAAWMLSHMAPTTRFVTVEEDTGRATAVRNLFRDRSNALVIHGDWHNILAYGPFDLLFIDAGAAKTLPSKQSMEDMRSAAEAILAKVHVGGIVVLDDLSPEEYWPEEWRGQTDPVREFWLNDVRVNATEVLTTPRTMAIMATRIG